MARSRGDFVEGHDESIGRGDFANMPSELMMREYPKSRMRREGELDDTMSDIDDVQGQAEMKRGRFISNQK